MKKIEQLKIGDLVEWDTDYYVPPIDEEHCDHGMSFIPGYDAFAFKIVGGTRTGKLVVRNCVTGDILKRFRDDEALEYISVDCFRRVSKFKEAVLNGLNDNQEALKDGE